MNVTPTKWGSFFGGDCLGQSGFLLLFRKGVISIELDTRVKELDEAIFSNSDDNLKAECSVCISSIIDSFLN